MVWDSCSCYIFYLDFSLKKIWKFHFFFIHLGINLKINFMAKVVYKYQISFEHHFTLELPKEAKILNVSIDEKINWPCMWVLEDLDHPKVEREFHLYGTGFPLDEFPNDKLGKSPKKLEYVGTFHHNKSSFVGHLFEKV